MVGNDSARFFIAERGKKLNLTLPKGPMHSLPKTQRWILQGIFSVIALALYCVPASAEILKIVVNDTIQPISRGIHYARHCRSRPPQRSGYID